MRTDDAAVAQWMLRVAAVIVSTGIALMWPSAAVAGGAALDGLPVEYYDSGNRFALVGFWTLLNILCPVMALLAYGLSRTAEWSVLRSFTAAQVAAAAVAAPVFLLVV